MMVGLTTSSTLPVFDQNGIRDEMPIELPVATLLDTLHVNRHDISLDIKGVIDAVGRYNPSVLESDVRVSLYAEGGYHYIFLVNTGGDKSLIARISRMNSEKWSHEWLRSKMSGEHALLKYLKRVSPSLPVPAIFGTGSVTGDTNGVEVHLPFLLMEKAKGIELSAVYSCLSMTQKITLTKKLARVMGDIFDITASSLGSVVGASKGSTHVIGSPVDSRRGTWPELSAKTYSMNELAISHINHLRNTCSLTAVASLDILDNVRQRICVAHTEDTYHLFHPDIRMPNVFVEGNAEDIEVTSIIDWDLHTFLPAPLAADYPLWLRFNGFYNPKYNPRGGQTEYWWEEDFDSIIKLQGEFRDAIRESHGAYYDHLSHGIAQRELFYWFYNWEGNQPYFDAVAAWSKSYI